MRFVMICSASNQFRRKKRGCQHRVEYGGSGQRNQPCVDRWCRTKAAQRESDKLDKAARTKRAMAVGGSGVGTKRPLESR